MVAIVGRDDRYKKRVTCRDCASILEFTPNEVAISTYKDISGVTEDYKYIRCPSCHSKVEVTYL